MGSTVEQKRPPRTKTRYNSATHQSDKKRIQNRTSQKCLRERKQAHTRHLESLAELMMVSQNDGDDLHKRNEVLVTYNLKLIEQNRQLQDALFRMKKKLMGLSNMATAAADDEVFDVLLGIDGSNKSTERSQSSDDDAYHEHGIIKGQAPATPRTSDGVQTSPLACDESTATDHGAPQRSKVATVCEDLSSTFGPPSSLMPNSLMQPLTFAFPNEKTGFKCVPTLMVKQLMKVCNVYLQQSSDTAPAMIPKWNEAGGVSVVDRLREAIVHILASWAGLESYLYGIGVFQHMELVVQWRLTRSLEDRLAIPDPFRPTPLQLNTDYPICVDFLNWPTIRDQLIMQKDDGDFTLLMRDIVMNTVIEFPALNASVNIHDLYYDKISPGSEIPDYLNSPKDAGHDGYDCLAESPAATDSELADRIVRRDLHQRMVHGLCPLTEDAWQSMLCGVYSPATPVFTRPPINLLAGCYGIDQVTKWKLSPAFARKYPSIDCVGGTIFRSLSHDP